MKCACASLKDVFYAEEHPSFLKDLSEKSLASWKKLCVCPKCGTLWAVDEWDKYHIQVVSRVSDIGNWDVASEEDRKKLLLDSRGGLTDEICIWAECGKNRVRGVAYCIDHLYSTGARK
jgi:hypothetical protein